MFKLSALKLNDSMLHSVAGAPPGWFPGNAASKAKFAKPISSTATFGSRAHDGTRGSTREQREPQQELPLAAVSDCQQHAVRSFPEHRRRDPKGPASAHVAPVCHMHYVASPVAGILGVKDL
jgi:hypothetical protein